MMERSSWPELDALCRIACALLRVPLAQIHLRGPEGKRLVAMHGTAPPHAPGSKGDHGALPLCAEARLIVGTGRPEGILSLFDWPPRSLGDDDQRQLDDLAALAAAHLKASADLSAASAQQALHRLLAENSSDTIVRGNLDGIRLYVSPAVKALLGYDPEELVGKRAIDIVHPGDAEAFRALMMQVRDGTIELGVSEQRQRHKDGSWVWLEAFVRLTRDTITGEPDGYVASVRNIGRRKAIEVHLAHIASHDQLTGLPNRAHFREQLDRQIAQDKRAGTSFAVLCLDLDRLKPVNDNFGHHAGDMVARLGGDEFIILQAIENDPVSAPTSLAERLIAAMTEPIDHNGLAIGVGLSIGIAVAGPDCLDADGLMQAADHALYEAKKAGRNTFRFAEPPPA